MDWVLVVLVFPMWADGLVTGWRQHHPTQAACEAAKADAARRAQAWGPMRDNAVVLQCVRAR